MARRLPLPELKAGDVLLYNDSSLIDRLICFRTWSDVAHVEVYLGNGLSSASRNGVGVNVYPLRLLGLRYIRRPLTDFNTPDAYQFARENAGLPYGWLDLAQFYGGLPRWFERLLRWVFRIPRKGAICSQWADLQLRAGKVVAFSEDYPAGKVSPRDFLVTPTLETIWER
jgi:hypothetical protein